MTSHNVIISYPECSGNFGFGGTLLEAGVPTLGVVPCTWPKIWHDMGSCRRGSPSPALGVRQYYPWNNFEILNAKSCNLVHILCCNCQYNTSYHSTCAGNALHDILTQTCEHRSSRVSAEKITTGILYIRLFAQSAVRQYSNQTIKLTNVKRRRKDRNSRLSISTVVTVHMNLHNWL